MSASDGPGSPSSDTTSQESLAQRYGVNQKTIARWKKRIAVKDLPTDPKSAHLTAPGIEREAIAVVSGSTRCWRWTTASTSCRQHPAPDALVPAPLSATPRDQPVARGYRRQGTGNKFKTCPIGYFHLDIAEVQAAGSSLRLFVAIDRAASSPLLVGKMIVARVPAQTDRSSPPCHPHRAD